MPEPFPRDRDQLTALLSEQMKPLLPGVLGIELVSLGEGTSRMRCDIGEKHLALNGYLHAASVIALADTTAGFGCLANLPEGGTGFTTIELKCNHVGTLLEGTMAAEGTLAHGGRTTQVWDVVVSDEATGRLIALFRNTQMILYPGPS